MVLATTPAAREPLCSVAEPSTALCDVYFHLLKISAHFSISAPTVKLRARTPHQIILFNLF